MDDDGEAASSNSKPKIEKCMFGKLEVVIPESLIEDVGIFMEVFSANTWQTALNDNQRRHLQKFLPTFPSNDLQEKQNTLRQVFSGQNVKFGNPAKQFHKKLKDGFFSPDIAKYAALCRKSKMREYRYQQQVYYGNLLKEVLVNRQRILEQVYKTPPYDPIMFEHFQWCEPARADRCLEYRVKKKCSKFIKEVNQECGFENTSSEEDDVPAPSQTKSKKQLFKTLSPPVADSAPPPVQATFAPKPELPEAGGAQKRPSSPHELGEDEFKLMLIKHKKRKEEDPDHPELDTAHVTLEDIIGRTQVFKKSAKGNPQKKKLKEKSDARKPKQPKDKADVIDPLSMPSLSLSQTLPFSQPPPPPLALPSVDASHGDTLKIKAEVTDEITATPPQPTSLTKNIKAEFGSYCHFFSLLRDFICEDPEGRITTMKLEEKVREWQESPSSQLSLWIYEQPTWVDQVSSALKFLSGDVLGLSLDNFIPYLDYKERAQQWKWIGHGRDSDGELTPLFRHWLENKEDNKMDTSADGSASPPPPRVRTSYVVRATSDDEKVQFRGQEEERFSSPHKAYTYGLHGYESVVGPVKGVYTKDNAMNKAREHALLISERPAYVTILTLVRDAAARLPNGEGTRSDICELLKDSQFLAPNVTDAQINTVVSGALDRLHYEKDPCVKYDVNRKLWIYLHRHRSVEEFERIHQAQGAAAKAKKQLQKPKPNKKVKETTTTPSVVTPVAPLTPVSSLTPLTSLSPITSLSPLTAATTSMSTLTRQSSVLSTGSNDSIINVETLSPASTPGPSLGSPKTPGMSPKVTAGMPSSPRTPQASPRASGASPKTLVSSLINQGQIQGQRSLQISAGGQIPTTRGTIITTAGGKLVAASPGKGVSSPHVKTYTQASVVSGGLGQAPTRVLNPSLVAHPGAHPQVITAGSKPIAFSLIQSQGGTKLVESVVAGQAQGSGQHTRTVLLTSRGDGQKIIATVQQPTASVQGTASPTMSPKTTAAASPKCATPPSSSSKALVTRIVQQQLAAAASQQGQQQLLVGSGGHQMVIPRQGQQVLNVSDLLAQSQAAHKHSGLIQQGSTTIKIQGGNLVHAVSGGKPGSTLLTAGGKPVTSLQRAQAQEASLQRQLSDVASQQAQSLDDSSSSSNATADSASSTVSQLQHTLQNVAGQSGTVTISKANTTSLGKQLQSAVSGVTTAQLIHSMGGKPLSAIGGQPIIIGGKPAMISGKPLQISGKPLHLIGKPGQIGLLQGMGGQTIVSAVNLVSQSGGTVMTAVPHQAGKATTQPSSNLMTQILQSGAIVQQAKPGTLTVSQGKVVANAGQQAKLVSQAQTGMVVTQLPQGVTGKVGGGHSRPMTVSQGGILQGSQLIMQPGQGQAKVVTPQQLLAAGGLRPQFITTQGGKPGQNIHLVKTVISQAGGKPGQTTILFAQPSMQSTSALVSSAGHLSQATLKAVTQTTSAVRTKGGPVYARIITPPPGIRLAAVRPGQVVTPGQMSGMQGMSVIQGMNRLPADGHVAVQSVPQQVVQQQQAVQQLVHQSVVQQQITQAAQKQTVTIKETDSSDSDQK